MTLPPAPPSPLQAANGPSPASTSSIIAAPVYQPLPTTHSSPYWLWGSPPVSLTLFRSPALLPPHPHPRLAFLSLLQPFFSLTAIYVLPRCLFFMSLPCRLHGPHLLTSHPPPLISSLQTLGVLSLPYLMRFTPKRRWARYRNSPTCSPPSPVASLSLASHLNSPNPTCAPQCPYLFPPNLCEPFLPSFPEDARLSGHPRAKHLEGAGHQCRFQPQRVVVGPRLRKARAAACVGVEVRELRPQAAGPLFRHSGSVLLPRRSLHSHRGRRLQGTASLPPPLVPSCRFSNLHFQCSAPRSPNSEHLLSPCPEDLLSPPSRNPWPVSVLPYTTVSSSCRNQPTAPLDRPLSPGGGHQVKVWNMQSGFCFVTFSEHTAPVVAVQWLPSGHALLSASLDGTVRAFDLVSSRPARG